MASKNSQHLDDMQRALDHELAEEELTALNARLEESEEAAETWQRLRKTDHLFRTTPPIAPAPGFAKRVMAAVAAMDLPDFARRPLSVGVALGLAMAAIMTLPVLSLLLILLLKVITDPGNLNALLQTVADLVSYLVGYAADLLNEIRTLVTDTPLFVVVLLGMMIPLTALWGWLGWHLFGGRRLASNRQKS